MDRWGDAARDKKRKSIRLLEERLVFRCARRARPHVFYDATPSRHGRERYSRSRFHDLLSVRLVTVRAGCGFKIGSIHNVRLCGAPVSNCSFANDQEPFSHRWFMFSCLNIPIVTSEHQRTVNKPGLRYVYYRTNEESNILLRGNIRLNDISCYRNNVWRQRFRSE